MLHQTPTPQTHMISAEWALKACQARIHRHSPISTRPHPQVYTGLHDLHSAGPCPHGLPHRWSTHSWSKFCWAMPPRPAQACTDIHSIGPAWSLLCRAIPSSLPCWISTHAQSPFHWAMSPRPEQACSISTLPGHTLKPCQATSHRHSLSPLGWTPHTCTDLHDLHQDHAPKTCQASNPQTCMISNPLAHIFQAHHAHTPKAH
jgi:hypothetical protein